MTIARSAALGACIALALLSAGCAAGLPVTTRARPYAGPDMAIDSS